MDFVARVYLYEDESIFGYVYDYDSSSNDVNLTVECDCGNYGDDYFEVGYTYSDVPDGTVFTFTAPYTGYFVFESYGENDPCFEYVYDDIFYFSQDDYDHDAGDFNFYVPVYLYEGEQIPENYICPLCKHGAADFEPIK